MKILALYNLKGGVGKTAASVNLSYLAALTGRRVLLWDLDPQGASTFYFRIRPKVEAEPRDLLKKKGREHFPDFIRGTDYDRLDLLPADFSYRQMDVALGGMKKSKGRLAKLLEPLAEHYDYVFLDCPPSISTTSEAVFNAAEVLLVPMIPTTLSERTLDQLQSHLDGEGLGDLNVWPFFSQVDRRKKLHLEVMSAASEDGGYRYLETQIPSASDIERMGLERQPVAAFAPSSAGARAFLSLWTEIERRFDAE
ncbi:MAG: ParA family protein [Acidobacteriota bacterium]